ncbi:monoglyceride lipase-like [Bolinopsis microptera]|uniref:monoglyceride lipase-like n=1 Tax=Bolinopsis microptera TaxID=2820187 RepID=UPI00307A84B5
MSDDKPEVRKRGKFVRQPSSKSPSTSSPVEVDAGPGSPVTEAPGSPVDEALCAGPQLYTINWPVENCCAHVYILHGYAEHCERYNAFCETLNKHKISVATHDHVGHGQSDGHRFHVDRFDTYVTDAIELMKEHRREVGEDKPFIMFGHSMGGLLATHCMLQVPELFTACILSSPCLKIHGKYNKLPLRVAARALSWIAPRFYIPSRALALDPKDVIADEKDREGYATDPLIWHYQSKPGFTVAVFDAIDEAQKNLMNLKVKCLVQHGTDDLVCDVAGVEPFKRIPEVAQLKLYEGARHALLLDTQEIRNVVIQDCLDFINSVVFDFETSSS